MGKIPSQVSNRRSRWGWGLATTIVACVLATALPVEGADPAPVHRIAYLALEGHASFAPFGKAFVGGLREHGYIEGRNIAIEWRFADDDPSRLAGLAAELIRLRPEVLVTDGTPGALAAKRASSTIPIVAAPVSDLVAAGLVASLARPGRNVTGLALMSPELVSRRLQLLKDVAPRTRRVAVVVNPDNPACDLQLRSARAAAPALGLELVPAPVRQPEEIDDAFSRHLGRVDAVLVTDDAFLDAHRPRIGTAAIRARLVSVCGYPVPDDRQCLMWYGPDLLAVFRRAAYLVDRILKGANPADLPVEQPTKFRLAINLKAVKAIGLTFPESILLRADEVVE